MLKFIALITMIIDHIGFFWGIYPLRIIGRLSFPIYCFLIARGVTKTKNTKKYMIRVLILAIISQCIWKYTGYDKLNILFTYFLFIQMMYFIKHKNYVFASIVFLIVILIHSILDYGLYGFALLFMFYYVKDFYAQLILITGLFVYFYMNNVLSLISIVSIATIFIIRKYDSPKYYKKFKKYNTMFYIMYPAHILILFELYKLMN